LIVYSESENGKVILFNASGKYILEKDLTMETHLDVQTLKQGIYILHVLVGEQKKSFKVFKK